MSHHLYVTPGFVLDTKNSGEANKLLFIFTRDLGLVMASAQGVRHLKSKLRFHTQPYTFGEFSLVRGKEIWRLTGAQENNLLFSEEKKTHRTLHVLYAQIFTLLKRLLPGEEANTELFNTLIVAFQFIPTVMSARKNATSETDRTERELLRSFEYVLVVRILLTLGYIGNKGSATLFAHEKGWSIELLEKAVLERRMLIEEINSALKASHL